MPLEQRHGDERRRRRPRRPGRWGRRGRARPAAWARASRRNRALAAGSAATSREHHLERHLPPQHAGPRPGTPRPSRRGPSTARTRYSPSRPISSGGWAGRAPVRAAASAAGGRAAPPVFWRRDRVGRHRAGGGPGPGRPGSGWVTGRASRRVQVVAGSVRLLYRAARANGRRGRAGTAEEVARGVVPLPGGERDTSAPVRAARTAPHKSRIGATVRTRGAGTTRHRVLKVQHAPGTRLVPPPQDDRGRRAAPLRRQLACRRPEQVRTRPDPAARGPRPGLICGTTRITVEIGR